MTVEELINKLQTLPKQMEVKQSIQLPEYSLYEELMTEVTGVSITNTGHGIQTKQQVVIW